MGLRFLTHKRVSENLSYPSQAENRRAYIEQWVNDEVWFRAAKKSVRPDAMMRRQIRDYRRQLLIRKYLEEELRSPGMINENMVLEYYKNNTNSFRTPLDAAFVEIYSFPNLETAKEIHNTVKRGERPALPPELLLLRSGECSAAFEKALFTKRTNGLLEPLSVKNHHYVITVIEYIPKNSLLRVEHVREEIIQKLQIETQMQRYQEHQNNLKEAFNAKTY